MVNTNCADSAVNACREVLFLRGNNSCVLQIQTNLASRLRLKKLLEMDDTVDLTSEVMTSEKAKRRLASWTCSVQNEIESQ